MNGLEVNDAYDDLDAAMASKKRARELASAELELNDGQDLDDKVDPTMEIVLLSICSPHKFILHRKIEAIIDAVDATCRKRAMCVRFNPGINAGTR